MKIAILSQDASLYSTKRLKEAGEAQGHEVRVINYLRCYMNITSHKPTVVYNGKPLESFDAIIPRIAASKTFYGTAVVRQFEVMNVFGKDLIHQEAPIHGSEHDTHNFSVLTESIEHWIDHGAHRIRSVSFLIVTILPTLQCQVKPSSTAIPALCQVSENSKDHFPFVDTNLQGTV